MNWLRVLMRCGVVCLVMAGWLLGGVSSWAAGKSSQTTAVPEKAYALLAQIAPDGSPPRGYRGGTRFANDGRGRGQVLPRVDAQNQPITYKEYDVNPYQKGVNRGAERVVVGSDGRAYYTNNHYRSFTLMDRT